MYKDMMKKINEDVHTTPSPTLALTASHSHRRNVSPHMQTLVSAEPQRSFSCTLVSSAQRRTTAPSDIASYTLIPLSPLLLLIRTLPTTVLYGRKG